MQKVVRSDLKYKNILQLIKSFIAVFLYILLNVWRNSMKQFNFINFLSVLILLVLTGIAQADLNDIDDIILLNSTDKNITVTQNNTVQIYGTEGINQVTLESNASAYLFNFPGNNIIIIQDNFDQFVVYRSGSTVTFKKSGESLLQMPATTSGQRIVFNDATFELIINSSNQVVLTSGTHVQEVTLVESSIDIETTLSTIAGQWKLHTVYYDIASGYANIEFNDDGTFSTDAKSGSWEQSEYQVDLYFDSGAHFSGTISSDGASMEGEALTANGDSGNWDATPGSISYYCRCQCLYSTQKLYCDDTLNGCSACSSQCKDLCESNSSYGIYLSSDKICK